MTTDSLDSLDTLERDLARVRLDLDTWLAGSYAGIEDRRYCGERDASYEGWGTIESLLGRVFDQTLLSRLSEVSMDSVLFFISRSDESGRIIAWLSNDPLFSHCGHLVYDDFLFLCERAIVRPDDSCDYQLASCYRKCASLGRRELDILQRFFQKQDSYTRRVVLQVFQHFGLPQVVDLATTLWNTDDCEFAKLSCLHALKAVPEAKPMFHAYLQEYRDTFDVDAQEYRQSHMRQLLANPTTDDDPSSH